MNLVANSVRDTTAATAVTGPSLAPSGGWARYDLVVCLESDPAKCLAAQRCSLASASTSNITTTCGLTSLAPYTSYTVAVRAAGRRH